MPNKFFIRRKISYTTIERREDICAFRKQNEYGLIFDVVSLLQITPTVAELSCILDHLEIAGDSPKLWATLSLELEAENSQRTETYWKKVGTQKSTEYHLYSFFFAEFLKNFLGIANQTANLTETRITSNCN